MDQNEALKTTTVHLLAAISLLRHYHAMAPTRHVDPFFHTKIADYEKAAETGRAAINWATKQETPHHG